MSSLLESKNLSLMRNDHYIIRDLSIEIFPKTVVNIFGNNGSGKTSILKVLAGITEKTNGEILKNNVDVIYVGHKYGLKSNLTIHENLALDNLQNKVIASEEIDNVIKKYQMIYYRDTLVKNLSHGQQKRVCLMRTMIINSNLWLLDEPYSALDSKGVEILNNTIKEAVSNNVAVLMTNHKKIEIEKLNVKNFKLEDGKIQ
tara:strand:+ start:364 stop:966 length:603 start_codon:yes stop_codon:yes gene_type:complete